MSIDPFLSVFTNIFYFGIVLGLAVIFHEWGHFIVGKLVGARVDEFAVGFGKKLFCFHWHGTEYSVRALPLGGLVKIRGMDPDDELTGAEWEYLQLAPWRRILIVIAGPFMNFVLAYLLYICVFLVFGQPYTATQSVGYVPDGSWGWEMGLHDGDKILAVNGKEVDSWDPIVQNQDIGQMQAEGLDTLQLTIERDGQKLEKKKTVPPSLLEENEEQEQAEIPASFQGIFITQVLPDSPASKAGIKPGMLIESADGIPLKDRNQWSDYIASRFVKADDGTYKAEDIHVIAQMPGEATQTLVIQPELILPDPDALPFHPKPQVGVLFVGEISIQEYLTPTISPLGIAPKLEPVVGTVKEGSPASEAGLTKNSRIMEVNGKPVDDWVDVLRAIYSAKVTQENETYKAEPLEFTWMTPDNEMHTASITPQVTLQNILTPTSIKTGKRYPIPGIGIDVKPDRKMVGVIGAFSLSWNKTADVCGFMVDFLQKLFTGNVSPQLLGGPIAIYQISGETGRWGWERFLGFIALLSLNLGLLNLFPFPPFDGGHSVVYLIEMVRMKPMTMKQMELFGKIGFALIIPLFIFLIFNDLSRTDLFRWMRGLFFWR